MTVTCQPLPRVVAEEMLQVVSRSICDRPGDNGAQQESRTRQMVHATMGFEPRDGLEYMLSTLVFGHFNMILDAMRDVFQGQTDALKAKSRSTVVALDRSMLALVKELRVAGTRPLARSAPDTIRKADAAPMPAETAAPVETNSQPSDRVTDATPAVASGPGVARSGSGRAVPGLSAAPFPAAPPEARAVPVCEEDEAVLREHMAAFQAAMAAAEETLAEARAFDVAKAEAANGD